MVLIEWSCIADLVFGRAPVINPHRVDRSLQIGGASSQATDEGDGV